jgi:16S rRNA (guanine527-N7)-methyltransferase
MTSLDTLAKGADALGVQLAEQQFTRFQTYLDGLAQWNKRTNLTSPAALANAERVHLLDSLTLVPLLRAKTPDARRLVDVGTGAGFPGLALKVAMPELHVVLVEATHKKVQFLRWMADELGLDDLEIVAERAELVGRDPAFRESFDVATARAVGTLAIVLELTLPLCSVGGAVLAQRGMDAAEEAIAITAVARALGGDQPTLETVRPGEAEEASSVLVVRKVDQTHDRFPRRVGIPTKRPLDTLPGFGAEPGEPAS